MTVDLIALKEQQSAARPARSRRSLDQETQSVLRVLPIRWRLLLSAAINKRRHLIGSTRRTLCVSWSRLRRDRAGRAADCCSLSAIKSTVIECYGSARSIGAGPDR